MSETRRSVRSIGVAAGLLLAIAILAAGCSSTTPLGTVTGRMYQVGGPAPSSPVAVRGVVTLTNVTTGTKYHSTVKEKSGYDIAVPTGTYRVSGLSESDFANGHEMSAFPANAVIKVHRDRAVAENVYVSIS